MHIEEHNIKPLLDRYAKAGINAKLSGAHRIYFPDFQYQTPLGSLKAHLNLTVADGIGLQKEYNKHFYSKEWNPILNEYRSGVQFLYDFVLQPTSLITMF